MGKAMLVRRPLRQLAPVSQHPHHQEGQWKVTKAHDTRLVLRVCRPSLAPRPTQPPPPPPPPVKTQPPAPCVPALTRLRGGVTVRRRPVEDFVDHLADAMGFGGPLPSFPNYYDQAEGSTEGDDVKLGLLLGFPVRISKGRGECLSSGLGGVMPRSRTHRVKHCHWSEADPTPGFTQVMDAPDLSNMYHDEPQHAPTHSFLDMTGWHPQDLLLQGTHWTEPSLYSSAELLPPGHT